MSGRGASAPTDRSAPTHGTGEDRSRTAMKRSGGGHVSSQASWISWTVVVEAGTDSSLGGAVAVG